MLRTALRTSVPRLTRSTTLTPSVTLARLLSQQARDQIQSAVNSKPLVLFMKGTPQLPQCGFSRAVVQILGLHEVPEEKMKTYDVLEDSELRSGIKEFSEWPTVPQVYVGGEFIGGCDIVLGMHQSGQLSELLVKHDIIPKIPLSELSSDADTPPS